MTGSILAGVINLILLTSCYRLTGASVEVKAVVGSSVFLPCKVDQSQCGELFRIKWYRGGLRIYVHSKTGNSRGEGDAMKRLTIENTENEARLRISPVEVDDEATYKCEITYIDMKENCEVVQVVKLRTVVVPAFVRLIGSNGRSLGNESILGPLNEGTNIEITCEANGGRPIPKVSWYNGTKEIQASYSSHNDGEGVGTGTSKLSVTLSRGDLGARFECRVESAALEQPIVSWITADVNVKPTKLELGGVNSHVVQGSNVLLTCDVYGAKPAADVKWYNNSDLIVSPDKVLTIPELMRDGTYTTKSSLRFVASRWENGQAFHCYAENPVTKDLEEPPLHEVLPLEVLYPPIVTVKPAIITTNESVQVLLFCSFTAHPSNLIDVVWSNDGKNLTLDDPDKYIGGNVKDPSLTIKSVTRDDMGKYRCICKNMVGSSESENEIFLNVQFPPVVEVVIEPSIPVKAVDKSNVTLTCNVMSGNPSELLNVEWYLDEELLENLPKCTTSENKTPDTFCSPNPRVLLLREVQENFAGFYQCRGRNIAGWGARSERKELIVYFPPGPALIQYFPSRVIKKGSVTLECSVMRPGRPEQMTFEWYRGNRHVPDVTSSNWTIYPVTLETKTNFTCLALNEGGKSTNASTVIDVLAPPSFIQALQPYQGVLANSKNIFLTCRVECSPLCSITWYKNGYRLNTENNPLYYVKNLTHLPDTRKNDFESVESTLFWNMSSWPNEMLDKTAPNSNYTCQSSSNGVGPGVNSTIEIAVDYPPENLTVTNRVISVVEHSMPERVICGGKGHPALSFVWKTSENHIISKNHILQLGTVTRKDSGTYMCEASNRHGTTTTTIILNVQYPPDCSIEGSEYEKNPAIMCSARADPQEIGFIWKIQGENDSTINPSLIHQEGLKSYLLIDPSIDTVLTYQCLANNSVGISEPCEYQVTGVKPWWKRFDNENMIILIAVVIGIIICVIIICIIIICICRRKRSQSKYNSHVELEEREKPSESFSSESLKYPKWPLKPGVLVHASALRNFGDQQFMSPPNLKTSQGNRDSLKRKKKGNKVYERLERLRDRIKYGDPGILPSGFYHSPNGVVTFRKLTTSSPINQSMLSNQRKRKKPGYAPNTTTGTIDRTRNGDSSRNGSKDPLTLAEKEFYENLPFHGMQNPPNKPVSVITPIMKNTQHSNALNQFPRSSQYPLSVIYNNYNNQSMRKVLQTTETLSRKSYTPENVFGEKSEAKHNVLNSSQTTLASFSFTPMSSRFQNSNSELKVMRSQSFSQQSNFSINLLQEGQAFQRSPESPKVNARSQLFPNVVDSKNKTEFSKDILSPVAFGEKVTFPSLPRRPPVSVKMNRSFGSLDIRKHRCYSPTFYSLRCKKHGRRRSVMYALPKSYFTNSTLKLTKHAHNKSPDCHWRKEDSKGNDNSNSCDLLPFDKGPVPAPRCRKHQRRTSHIYQNLNSNKRENCENSESTENKDKSAISTNTSAILQETAIVHNQDNTANEKLLQHSSLNISTSNPFNSNANTTETSNFLANEDIPTNSSSNDSKSKDVNKPYRSDFSDLEYADIDYRSYGPINYKAASQYALVKKNKNKLEEKQNDDLL